MRRKLRSFLEHLIEIQLPSLEREVLDNRHIDRRALEVGERRGVTGSATTEPPIRPFVRHTRPADKTIAEVSQSRSDREPHT
jgi:hypothetical protein